MFMTFWPGYGEARDPCRVITALAGAPFFLYLLAKTGGESDGYTGLRAAVGRNDHHRSQV